MFLVDRLCYRSANAHYTDIFSERFALLIVCFSQHPSRGRSVVLLENIKCLTILHLYSAFDGAPPSTSQTLTHSLQGSGEGSQCCVLPS